MNISKISTSNNFNCTFGSRRRNIDRSDFAERCKESPVDYFSRGLDRIDTLDNEYDPYGERDNYDTFEPQKEEKVDIDDYDPNFEIRSEYLRNLYDLLSDMTENQRIAYIKKHFHS